jgi:hypothetical protein
VNLVLDQKVPQVRDHNPDLRTLGNNSNLSPRHLSRDNSHNLRTPNNNSNSNSNNPRVNLDLVKDHPQIQLPQPQADHLR